MKLTAALVLAAALGGLALAEEDTPREQRARYSEPKKIGLITDKRLSEVSGIVPVSGLEKCYWVHNDSGDKPRILAIREKGDVIAEVSVRGAAATDWEDIAKGPGPITAGEPKGPRCLFLADTGNNAHDRKVLVVWRIREPRIPRPAAAGSGSDKLPEVSLESEPAAKLSFYYPGDPWDCEAMVVHPETGRIYLLTKGVFGGKVFALDGSAGAEEKVQTAEEVAEMGRTMMTGADLSPDGLRLVVRTYLEVQLYVLPRGRPFEEIFTQPKVELPRSLLEVQGEAICFDADGSVVTVSEATPKVIHRISPAGESKDAPREAARAPKAK